MLHLIFLIRHLIGTSTLGIGKGLLLSLLQSNEVAVSPLAEATSPPGTSTLDSEARLQALYATGLWDSPPERAFDRLTELACRFVQAPIALVSFVDDQRQFFKSSLGLPEPVATERTTPLSHSFCQHVVTSQQPLVITDARDDPRVCDNLAIRDLNVIAYLGIPLSTTEGHVLGSLCVIDHCPRQWSEADVEILSELAALVMTEIELRHHLHEQQQAEQKLRESEEIYRVLFEQAGVGKAEIDLQTKRLLRVNQKLCEITGYNMAELQTMTYTQLLHPDDWPPDRADQRIALIAGRNNYSSEHRFFHKDGALKWLEVNVSMLHRRGEQSERAVATLQDVTERKLAEDALRTSEAFNRSLFEHSPDCLKVLDFDGNLLSMNSSGCRLLEVENLETLIGASWVALWPDQTLARAAVSTAQKGGIGHFQDFGPTLKGALKWWDVMVVRIHMHDGPADRLLAVSREITQQRQAQQQLVYYSHLLENMYDAVIATDAQFKITAWNPGAEQMYGWQASEVIGLLVNQVIHSVLSDEQRLQSIHTLNTVGRCRLALQTQHRNGALIETEAITVALRAGESQITGYLSINRDIAERKRYELILQEVNVTLEQQVAERTAELKRSNRELDQFAYIASHDLKSPLRAINHLANWISEDAQTLLPPSTQQHLTKLHGRVSRMEKLLDDLLAYSRAGRIQYQQEIVQLRSLFQNLIEWLSPPPGFTITLTDTIPTMVTARVPLETVLRNLLGNAIKHHHNPNEGQVHVAVQPAGEWVTFSITDNGPGIDPSYHERIFQIFQTLRPRDEVEGSGIGLAVVKKTVESYGGVIHVESQLDQGTTFRFTWPKEPLVNGDFL
ncbi:hypothetical protein BH10CHL1_BH10CHL1_39220 [soil metagenome]